MSVATAAIKGLIMCWEFEGSGNNVCFWKSTIFPDWTIIWSFSEPAQKASKVALALVPILSMHCSELTWVATCLSSTWYDGKAQHDMEKRNMVQPTWYRSSTWYSQHDSEKPEISTSDNVRTCDLLGVSCEVVCWLHKTSWFHRIGENGWILTWIGWLDGMGWVFGNLCKQLLLW